VETNVDNSCKAKEKGLWLFECTLHILDEQDSMAEQYAYEFAK